jgi:hypothetical protein
MNNTNEALYFESRYQHTSTTPRCWYTWCWIPCTGINKL